MEFLRELKFLFHPPHVQPHGGVGDAKDWEDARNEERRLERRSHEFKWWSKIILALIIFLTLSYVAASAGESTKT